MRQAAMARFARREWVYGGHAVSRWNVNGIRALLLDKDGTLIDYAKTWVPINREVAAYASKGDMTLRDEILRSGGHDPVTDIVAAGSLFAGAGLEGIVAHMAAVTGTRAPADLYARTAESFRQGGASGAVLIDGIREAMQALKDFGIVLGIATNDTADGLAASLGRYGVIELCAFTCGCDSGHGVKPGPGMVQAFCRATGIASSAVAVVGDSIHDLEMASRAGAGRIAVLSGTSGRGDLAPHADLVLDSVRDLPELFAYRRT